MKMNSFLHFSQYVFKEIYHNVYNCFPEHLSQATFRTCKNISPRYIWKALLCLFYCSKNILYQNEGTVHFYFIVSGFWGRMNTGRRNNKSYEET